MQVKATVEVNESITPGLNGEDETTHVTGKCKGFELSYFKFTPDLEYIIEKSINYAENTDDANSYLESSPPEGRCNGRCQLTNSTYQIHITDEKRYISSFDYNDGKFRKSGASKVEFLTPPGEETPQHYEGIVMGFEDGYREKHVGRPINKILIELYRITWPEDCEWQRRLLRHRGKMPLNKHTDFKVIKEKLSKNAKKKPARKYACYFEEDNLPPNGILLSS